MSIVVVIVGLFQKYAFAYLKSILYTLQLFYSTIKSSQIYKFITITIWKKTLIYMGFWRKSVVQVDLYFFSFVCQSIYLYIYMQINNCVFSLFLVYICCFLTRFQISIDLYWVFYSSAIVQTRQGFEFSFFFLLECEYT